MTSISFYKKSSLATISLLVALTVSPEWVPSSPKTSITFAQTAEEIPARTQVKVHSSHEMEPTSEEYKESFETSSPDNSANIEIIDSNDNVVKSLLEGETDVGAIGRPLTEAEKAEGLKEIALERHKIAIIVGKDNPFNQSITDEQFVKIFRGEIKDWSEIGGSPGPIRVIDRPESNGARRSMEQYAIFQTAPFDSSPDAIKLTDDSLEAAINELGPDGISYAIYEQVQENQDNIKILPMHDTLPDDERYPFSQPRYFIYEATKTTPLIAAFLKINLPGTEVTPTETPPAETTETPPTETTETPPAETAQAPPPAATTETDPGAARGFPWWILLLPLLGLLGGLAWFLLPKNQEAAVVPGVVPPPPLADPPTSRIILTPRNCREAYAYWEVPAKRQTELKRQGGERLQLRILEADSIGTENLQVYDCTEEEQDKHVTIPLDNRDYLAELGYLTANNDWLSIARSSPVRVPACPPEVPQDNITTTVARIIPGAAAAAAAAATTTFFSPRSQAPETSQLILVPRDCRSAYAYWEVPAAAKAALRD
ncbi:MAG: DUF4912 domain-containing protein, partial [Gomphosphaeria aponina SAG 52.96 = DSM 107014]|nr:DUF4912 domain-containing protein [Gomphosphaeria aponina SAG 52.96 = DSM 107014]